jgi:cytochrome c
MRLRHIAQHPAGMLACSVILCADALSPQPALAGDARSASQLAADRGCYNCHAEPSRKSIRSFGEIRKAYASLKGRPDAERQAIERMHHGSLFTHVAAHERLPDEEAALLIRWLFAGTP